MPNAIQTMTFDAVSGVSRSLRQFKQSWTRTVPPITRALTGALRSINGAVSGAADIQRQLRPIARGEWSWILRLLLSRADRTAIESEARSALRLVSTASTMEGKLRSWRNLLGRSTQSVNAMVLPYPVDSCRKYNNFRQSYQTVQQLLPSLIGLLDSVDTTITDIQSRRPQLVSDFNQTINLTRRVRDVLDRVYSSRVIVWRAGNVAGITAWGWRVIGIREQRWDRKTYAQKRDAFYGFFRRKRDEMREAYTGMVSAKGEMVSFFSQVPGIQTTVRAQKTLANNLNGRVSTVTAPDVCPAGYSGLTQSAFVPDKSVLIPLAVGVGLVGLLIWSDEKR